MSSFSDTSSYDGLAFEQKQISRKANETKQIPTNLDNEKGPSHANKEIVGLCYENNRTPKHLCNNERLDKEKNLPSNLKEDPQTLIRDILNLVKKTTNEKLHEPDNSFGNHLYNNERLDKEENPKLQSFSPKTFITHNVFSSDAMHNEKEMELGQLQNLKTQFICKLTSDENIIDQSKNSRSPSPVTPELEIPCCYAYAIIVHEANSDDDSGSEELETIPHRYESESYLYNLQNNRVYENKLSLAAELLRTEENLPYDDEFKRIVDDCNVQPRVQSYSKLNLGFRKDSCFPEKSSLTNNTQNKHKYNTRSGNGITSQRQINPPDNSSDSAIFSDAHVSNVENEICEPSKEIV